ncbi:hypothetical protein HHI36_010861 [Cryptolaemus montrouzieri]|uniref:Nose resistant-to-fluoxetine protein N-terminal domain-containing protein n=1 Tax=Cryptolaemus montrouzieri TaxID=559131 RepID=A0ABD2MK41_9CUCU
MKILVFYVLLQILVIKFDGVDSVNYLKHTINIVVNKLEKVIEESVTNKTQCGNDLKMLIHDLIKRKKWAIQMIDASAKIEPGVLVGNVNQIGNYDQCLAIEEIKDKTNISGQYCTMFIIPNTDFNVSTEFKGYSNPMWIASLISSKAMSFLRKNRRFVRISYGMCVPSSCSVENLHTIWRHIEHVLAPAATVIFDDILCDYKGKPSFYFGVEPVIIIGFVLYFLALLAATIYDVFFFNGDEDTLYSYICTLSLRTNVKKLFSTEIGEDNIPCINGLKVLSMLWVLIGHRFLVNALTPNINSLYLFEWKENIGNMAIIGATVTVDSFLAISGLLLSYIYLRYTELKNLKINITSFYLLRICRLTPPLLAIISIYIALLKYINDGPLWPFISAKLAKDCLFYGWTNLLYVNNFVQLTSQCLPQSWYLSVDSQMYFMFPLIFFSIAGNSKRTLCWMLFIGIVSSISSLLITIQYGYKSSPFDFRYGNDIYQSTFLRMPVWLIGVTTGYFVFKFKDKEFSISKKLKIILWISTLIILNLIVFGQIFLIRNESNAVHSAIFNAFGRPLWASAICWIVFACATKNGGCVNKFLSLPIFNFVAKITYSLFLTHFMVILVFAGRKRHVDHFNNIRAIHEFCGDAVFSLVVGVCFSLFFESPLITFAKKFFRRFELAPIDESGKVLPTVIKYKMWFIPVEVYTRTKIE